MHPSAIDSLEDLWPIQAALNAKSGFDTLALGEGLNTALAGDPTEEATEAARLATGKALKAYLDAMSDECSELQNCLAWKHWYAEAKEGKQHILQDVQNARVEIIDMLFFWISLAQSAGITPQDVYRLYEKKLGINHKRQDEGRSQAEHGDHEGENRNVV